MRASPVKPSLIPGLSRVRPPTKAFAPKIVERPGVRFSPGQTVFAPVEPKPVLRLEAPWSSRAKALAREAMRQAAGLSIERAMDVGLRSILGAPEVQGADVGLVVQGKSGVLFERGADLLLNPASNSKIAAALFALEVLGPEHRFSTEVRRDGADLHWVGAFDPSLSTESLDQIAAEIRRAGVRSVGDVVLDNHRFEGPRRPPGFERYGDQDWQYLATPESLSVNKNLIELVVFPGDQLGHPATVKTDQRAFEIETKVETIAAKQKFRAGVDERDQDGVLARTPSGRAIIDVFGTIALDYEKGKVLTMKSPDPVAGFDDEVMRAFERAGIEVRGKLRSGMAPKSAEILYTHRSLPLATLLETSLSTSNAFDHEMYVLAAAAQRSMGVTSLVHARGKLESFLVDNGVESPQMQNASGIGNLNRLSTRGISKLLDLAQRHPRYHALTAALARPGKPGTLATRMLDTRAEASIHAKTGTGDKAVALSGYVEGRDITFSAIIDEHPSRDGARAVLDAIGVFLAEMTSRTRSKRTLL